MAKLQISKIYCMAMATGATSHTVWRKAAKILASDACWYAVLALFVVQAVWLAFSAAYPMAFDESYHLGLIQLHAQQWLPFLTSQPDTGAYGAAGRDPSYLYHWLMSYPYRLVAALTHSQTAQIICLRLLNVALFAYALVLYRRVLRRVGVPAAAAHAMLLAFILIPVTPFLAATINYDNLLLVAVAWSALLAFDVLAALKAGRLPLARTAVLATVLVAASLIKYPFLPIAFVIVAALIWRAARGRLLDAKTWQAAWAEFRRVALIRQIVLVALLLACLGLFAERYAVNTFAYHTPVPKCDQVESDDVCLQYGPWQRDYWLAQTKPGSWHPDLLAYTGAWIHGMWYRLYFGIGPAPRYDTQAPLFLISRIGIGICVLLLAGLVWRWRKVFAGHPERILLFWIIVGYGLALFADNYAEYRNTGEGVAINGRYWLPLLPFFFGLGGLAWLDILRKRRAILVGTTGLVLAVMLLQGGGAMTFIVRSSDGWYWPDATVRRVNGDIRTAVSPAIFGKGLSR